MPNRIVRDGILRSERVNSLEPLAELFYRRLMSVVDDYGRTEGHPTLLRASCYPLLIDEVDEVTIKLHLKSCQDAGLIQSYVVDGKQFIQLLNFNQQVRAKASKFPDPPPIEKQVRSKCVADDVQVISNAHLDVDVDVDVDGGECGDGTRPAAVHSHAETPSLDEVKAYAATIGLVEWKAVDWFQKQEAVGWMMNNQPIRAWRPLLDRVRTFWESDGRPLKPSGKNAPAPASDAAMPDWVKIKTIEEQLAEHPGNPETVYYRGDKSAKEEYRGMKRKLKELKTKQREAAVA